MRHLLVSRFLHDAMRPASHARVPAWDLVVVLEGLSMAHFEPIESVLDKFLMLKTAFLCVFTSLKRIGDLQALSVASSCLEFYLGRVKAFLLPRLGYMPTVPTNIAHSVLLQAFCPSSDGRPGEAKLALPS